MKTLKTVFQRTRWVQCLVGIICVGLASFFWSTAKADVLPGLSIQLIATNQLQLTVTNGVPTNNYMVYYRPSLLDDYPWTPQLVGTNGQTNFTVMIGLAEQGFQGFFQARTGDDADGDGVLNWKDADPYNAAVGILYILIDAPANGSVFW